VFADALAGKYDGLSEALCVVKAGGFYVIDDMLPQPNWPDGHAPKSIGARGAPWLPDGSTCLGEWNRGRGQKTAGRCSVLVTNRPHRVWRLTVLAKAQINRQPALGQAAAMLTTSPDANQSGLQPRAKGS